MKLQNLLSAFVLATTVTATFLSVPPAAHAASLPDKYSCSVQIDSPTRSQYLGSPFTVTGIVRERPSEATDTKVRVTLRDEVGTILDQEEVELKDGTKGSFGNRVLSPFEATLNFNSPATKRGHISVEHFLIGSEADKANWPILCDRERKIFFSPDYIDNTIIISNPQPNQTIGNPVKIQGFATMAWFKYTRMRVEVRDANGNVLARGRIKSQPYTYGTWPSFAPENLQYFEIDLKWRDTKAQTNTGSLYFYSTNVRHERFIKSVPVRF